MNIRWIVAGAFFISALIVQAEMHAFELTDGRTLEAEIVDYNARLGQVTLKRADGRRLPPVKPDLFIEADQQYIKEWTSLQTFLSDRELKISCDDKTVDERKEEEYKDLRYGDDIERTLMKETEFEKIAYEFSFQNMNEMAIDNVRMEYVIYYEQSKETFEKPIVVQKTFKGKMDLPALAGKKKTTAVTNPVEIHNDNINSISWTSGQSRTGGKGDVHGIRARIYITTPSGKEVMREFSHPAKLSPKKFAWVERR